MSLYFVWIRVGLDGMSIMYIVVWKELRRRKELE